uniref:Tudor domain-containing protein n=1 Tax=Panagrellus redivivus TaxID=6233 RepID=A0A7E4V6Z1_PANRE
MNHRWNRCDDFVSTQPFFGFAKDDSHLERVIVTNLYDTKVWSEKKKMFAPKSRYFSQYTVHPITASVTAAVPSALFHGIKKNFPQKDVAGIVVAFSPERFKYRLVEKIVRAAAEAQYRNYRLINVRDALFMGVAYAENVDMPIWSMCLFVIINEKDFHITVYYRTDKGYLPRIEHVIPYDMEHPEEVVNRLKPLRLFLMDYHSVCAATYIKEEPLAILKQIFGQKWFAASMNDPDAFYHQHLCIAGGVVKGRYLIGAEDMHYFNVIECCPYDFQVRDAHDEVLVQFFVAHQALPLERNGKASSTSKYLLFYCRSSTNPEWFRMRTIIVDHRLETVQLQLKVDINCEYRLLIDGNEGMDYRPK